MRPFVRELKVGREERLRGHIEERIFQHLMRQSDVGIAYDQVSVNFEGNFMFLTVPV